MKLLYLWIENYKEIIRSRILILTIF